MCKSIPLEAPWNAKNAQTWDQITLAKWLSSHTLSKPAHATSRNGDCRLLHLRRVRGLDACSCVYQLASGGGPGFVLGGKDASQDSRPVGGMGAIYRPMTAEIGESLHPLAAGPANRAGRGRRDGALR